jgi:hypothetical protein
LTNVPCCKLGLHDESNARKGEKMAKKPASPAPSANVKKPATPAPVPAAPKAATPAPAVAPAPKAAPAAKPAPTAKPVAAPVASTTTVRNSPVPKPAKAATAPSPAVAAKREITQADIAKRAYEIWASGQGGSEMENWLRAERELRGI